MYSRRSLVRIFGRRLKRKQTLTLLWLEIANKIEVKLEAKDLAVSHRVGKVDPDGEKPRPIIARINNYAIRHELIKKSRDLRETEDMAEVSVNQELTKYRAKLAYECRKLVRLKKLKLTFIWDGKIFVIDKKENKRQIRSVRRPDRSVQHVRRTTKCSKRWLNIPNTCQCLPTYRVSVIGCDCREDGATAVTCLTWPTAVGSAIRSIDITTTMFIWKLASCLAVTMISDDGFVYISHYNIYIPVTTVVLHVTYMHVCTKCAHISPNRYYLYLFISCTFVIYLDHCYDAYSGHRAIFRNFM